VSRLDPAEPPPPIVERAYQLARSGKFAAVDDICRGLFEEGYRELYLHFEGPALRADLARKCREAQGRPASGSEARSPPRRVLPSRSSRFEQKAAECRQLADNAQHAETRQIYVRLVLSYEGWLNRPSKAKEKPPQTTGSLPGVPAEPFADLLVFRCDGGFRKIRAAASAPAAPKENSFHPSPRQSAARRGQSLLSIAEDCSGASTLPDQARHSAGLWNITRCRPHPFASPRRARDPDRARYRGSLTFRI